MIDLTGKRGLVVGIANASSIAYGCAKAYRALGAELAVTYLNPKSERFVRPLAEELGAPIDPKDDLMTHADHDIRLNTAQMEELFTVTALGEHFAIGVDATDRSFQCCRYGDLAGGRRRVMACLRRELRCRQPRRSRGIGQGDESEAWAMRQAAGKP